MLSKKQIKFLKQISKKPTSTEELKSFVKSKNIDFKFLEDIMDLYEVTESNDRYKTHTFEINQKGMAVIENYRHHVLSELRNWITTAIAVAAFVLSLISLQS